MKKGRLLYTGKAKSVFASQDNQDEVIIEFRDDITAFNGEKHDTLAGKGLYNVKVSSFFFRYLEQNGVKTHYVGMPDERTMVAKALTMIPLEVIARNRAAGLLVKKFPFTRGQILDPPILVIDYKDDERGDPSIPDDVITALDLVTPEELQEIRFTTLKINKLLYDFFDRHGLIFVDIKVEFGRDGDQILLGDEISMDSMRLWDKETGESLDKDVYRLGKGDVMDAYARVVTTILGEEKEGGEEQ